MSRTQSQSPLTRDAEITYVHTAHTRLSKAWEEKPQKQGDSKKPNRRGMRAVFRRWSPDASKDPTSEMRRFIWGWMGSPMPDGMSGMGEDVLEKKEDSDAPALSEEELDRQRRQKAFNAKVELDVIDKAAIVTAMRASAGDHEGGISLGRALYRAEMNDLRLSRLLTCPRSGQLDSLQRAMKLINAKRIGIKWTQLETKNMIDFLFGDDRTAQRAANAWAADFFRSRGKTDEPESDSQDGDVSNDTNQQPL